MNCDKRIPNYEMLRLVAIIMVVTVHYIGWGGAANNTKFGEVNFFVAGILAVLSQVCINCFYLISGYFLKVGENVNWIKAINFWGKVLFYSILVPLVLVLLGFISLSEIRITNLIFPITTNQYWFASIFLIIIIVSPLLGKMLQVLSDKQLGSIILVLFLFDSIQPMFFHNATGEIGFGLLHAIVMIVIGNYIYRVDFSFKKIPVGIFIYLCSIGIGSIINVGWLLFFGERNKIVLDYNSPFVILASIALFIFFKQLKIKSSIVNKISPYFFAIYLVNDNSYMRKIVYKNILHCDQFYHSKYFVIHYILSVMFFMFIGVILDIIRKKLCILLNLKKIMEGIHGRYYSNNIN